METIRFTAWHKDNAPGTVVDVKPDIAVLLTAAGVAVRVDDSAGNPATVVDDDVLEHAAIARTDDDLRVVCACGRDFTDAGIDRHIAANK